jgi:hypothetical protein
MKRLQRLSMTLITAAAALGATLPASAITTLVCELRGTQEVPPNPSPARGWGRFDINTSTNMLSYHIAFTGLMGAETAAHIHGLAGPGVNAGVIVALPVGNPKVGVWVYPEANEQDLLNGRMYVNIHSLAIPGGEIRGQIGSHCASLNGFQENPSIATTGSGWGHFTMDTVNNLLRYYIALDGALGSAETAAHIHGFSHPTVNSAVVHVLPAGFPKVGAWNYPESAEEAILDGRIYVNVHTVVNPGGEIRGQICSNLAPLDGLQETPPLVVPGAGGSYLSVDRAANSMGLYIEYAGLGSAETAAHIHGFAPPGAAAGVLFALPAPPPATMKKAVWAYGAANAAPVLDGRTYVNIHTVVNGGGELRGQNWLRAGPRCPADCVRPPDKQVTVSDLLAMLAQWGGPGSCDINNDGTVDIADLLGLLAAFGLCP